MRRADLTGTTRDSEDTQMKPLSTILVPVDFSAHSDEALRFAADLARRYDAALQLLHVFEPPSYALPEGYVLPSPDQLGMIISEIEKKLSAAKADALISGAPRVSTLMLQGGAVSEILRLSVEGGYGLIVMGTHGRTGIKHLIIGSVAENVVRKAACPVLTMRAAV
jgi:nucleotide-binding universal stress UspA family protein